MLSSTLLSVNFQKKGHYDVFNKLLMEKYKDSIDKKKQLFVAGTIFLAETKVKGSWNTAGALAPRICRESLLRPCSDLMLQGRGEEWVYSLTP